MTNTKPGWIGVDLDRTLAHYDEWHGPCHIGEPIPSMVNRVRAWLAEGREVRIFTARISHDGSAARMIEANDAYVAIANWCIEQFDRALLVTNVKDYDMLELWDDRAVQVIPNTGVPITELLTAAKARLEYFTGKVA